MKKQIKNKITANTRYLASIKQSDFDLGIIMVRRGMVYIFI